MNTAKVRCFIKELETKKSTTEEDRIKAMEMIAEMLRKKNILLLQKKGELEDIARDLRLRRDRLYEIKRRLDITIKAGIANDTIH